MKKVYIAPETLLTMLSQEKVIAASETLGLYGTGGSDQLVKEDKQPSSTSSYNVWDDDWSE